MRIWIAALLVSFSVGCSGNDGAPWVAPEEGRQSGGERLRIEGSDFLGHGALVVYVGDRAAKQVVVESARLITVLTPQSETPGAVDVVIAFDDGTRVELPKAFTFNEEQGIVLQPKIGS